MKHLTLCTILIIIAIATNQISCKFSFSKILDKYRALFGKDSTGESNSKVVKFSYQNCGPNSDPFQVNTLQITPDPLKLPGDVYMTGDANVKQNITGPLTMTLKIIKIIGPVKFEIPCVDNFGSCTYPDVCSMLPPPDQCPPFFKENNIPCNCPFPIGDYSAKNVDLQVDLQVKIPSGQYIVLANFQNQDLGHVACIQMGLSLA